MNHLVREIAFELQQLKRHNKNNLTDKHNTYIYMYIMKE
jgi:hypothetical protein